MGADRDNYATLSSLLGCVEKPATLKPMLPPSQNSWEMAASTLYPIPAPPSPLLSSLLAAAPPTPSVWTAAAGALSGLSSLATAGTYGTLPTLAPAPQQWLYVTRRFDQLIDNIGIQQTEIDDGTKKLGRLIGSLNRCYYPGESAETAETAHSVLIGSWAKRTRVRPFSDIDVLFILPYDVYLRFENRMGNKQSQILAEVRANLKGTTYPRTEINGDRHVVVVEVDGVTIEVAPAFELTDGRYWVCDTKNNGSYKLADPAAELQALQMATASNENARQLTRLLKKWQIHNDVSIKAFQLERLAIDFLAQWPNSMHDRFWYDWMMRDFFAYMIGRANGWVCMPGTGEWIELGSSWLGAAKLASRSAITACDFERANSEAAAGRAWGEIFGNAAPVTVS